MAIKLPYQQTDNRQFNQFQQALAAALMPITNNPASAGVILQKVSLASGANTVPHKLDKELQGWIVIRRRGNATIWDSQDSNSTPDKTLLLNASTAVVIDLMVF